MLLPPSSPSSIVVVVVLGRGVRDARPPSDVAAPAALSAETRQRDRPRARPTEIVETAPSDAAEAEAAGELARYRHHLAPAPRQRSLRGRHPTRRRWRSAAASSSTGRPSPSTSAGFGTFAAAGFVAFLWPTAKGGFGQPVTIGKLDDILRSISAGNGFFYAPRPARGSRSTRRTPSRRPAPCTPPNILTGMRARHRRPLPEVPAPRLPRAVVRHQPVVRVPVPRLAVQPGRREEGRPRPPRHGPLPGDHRRQRRRHGEHRHASCRAAHRHQHDRSGGRGAALHHRWGEALVMAFGRPGRRRPLVHLVSGARS